MGPDDPKEIQIQKRMNISAQIVHETILREGEEELRRSSWALAWSALAAGLSMGFSFIMEGALESSLPAASWSVLVTKLGYPVGFLIVILGRQQLFTENTLTPVLPLLHRPRLSFFANVMRLWSVVLLFNVIGSALFALLLAKTNVFSAETHIAYWSIGRHVVDMPGGTMFVRAIFAGWLIALTIWLLPSADHARFWVIIVLTYLIGIGRFPHIIASSTEVFYLCMTGVWPWGKFFGGFFFPTLLGNITGGVALVAALNHAQVSTDNSSV